MNKGFLILLCFLLAAQIVVSLGDPRTQKPHKRRESKHRESRSKLRNQKSQTQTKVQRKHLQESKTLSKESDNFENLESVLFDREQLKSYVLDYLRTHGLADSLHDNRKSAGRQVHRDKVEPRISAGNRKHKHHGADKNDKSGSRHEEYYATKRNSVSDKKSHHQRLGGQVKGFPFPIYYSVREESDKESRYHRLSSDHKRGENKAERRSFKKGTKVSDHRKEIGSKRTRQGSKHGNKNTNEGSSLNVLSHSLYHGKAKYKIKGEGEATRHRNKIRQNGTKSNKRDFIAVLPPQSFKLEGFDVDPVDAKLHDKRKRKSPQKQRHRHAKKNVSHKQSSKQEHVNKRKTIVTSESDENGEDDKKAGRVHKKSRQQEIEGKSTVTQKSSRKDSRKKSKGTSHEQSSEENQITRRKSTVKSKLHRHDHTIKKGRVQKISQLQEDREGTVKSKHDARKKSETASRHQKSTRKSSVKTKSSKHHHREKQNSDRGHKKSIVQSEGKSTFHRRKKAERHRDSQELKFSPSWKSLDKRKIPSWYDEAKFGIFVHWGVYSVPSFDSEWFWYKWKGRQLQKYLNYTGKNFPPGFSYSEFAPMFKAEFFDAKQWAELVARSGARYFVFTSKHHEGFTNWNSSVAWNWNSVDVGPHRNIVDELAKAFRNLSDPKVRFGLYYSLFEWFNPHYLNDKANGFKTDRYIKAVVKPQLYDLVNAYKPDYLWTDGDWEAKDSYWKSKEFLTWLFNESPVKDTVVVNDRWGRGCRCHHGGVYTGQDRFNPGKLQETKWENAMTIDRRSWGFRRDANLKDYLSIEELITQLVTTVSCGGNLLMNVGPASDGTISPIFQERLTQMGDWLRVNGDAIYKTRPWRAQNDSVSGDVWYTSKHNHVFAIALSWPRSGKLMLASPTATPETRVTMLGTNKHLKWTHRSKHKGGKGGVVIHVPAISVSDLPCMWAWVFKLSHVK